jgi:hypothetical protein
MPSVSFIGNDAFNGAANLQSIVLSNQISFLGESVFKDCSALTEAIVEPSIYELPASTFEGCSSLDGSQGGAFTVGGLVNSLGEYAFKDCTALTVINCTNAITSIGANAFENDDALTSFTMGLDSTGSITIGDEAFKGCGALADIELPVPTITVGTDSFLNAFASEVTVKAPKSFLANLPNTSSYNYIYPAFVDTMASAEWQNDTKLLSATIPDSITAIPGNAFRSCTNLRGVSLPGTLTSLGTDALRGCTSLTEVTIPESVTTIGNNLCFGDTALTTATLGNTTGQYMFGDCTALTEIDFTGSPTAIETAFALRCSALASVILPDTVTSIGSRAFEECSALTELVIPSAVTSIASAALKNLGTTENLPEVTFNAKTMATVQGMTNYPWGLRTGSTVHCSDGDITI